MVVMSMYFVEACVCVCVCLCVFMCLCVCFCVFCHFPKSPHLYASLSLGCGSIGGIVHINASLCFCIVRT